MEDKQASVAIVGAGDFIGTALVERFAAAGYAVFGGRRNGDKMETLARRLGADGARVFGRTLDARQEDAVRAFIEEADAFAPLELVVFNIGPNVRFPILDTSERVFRKLWEMSCYAGFLTGREAARVMIPRGRGKIFFTGATASLRGGDGFAAFASAKAGLRIAAQSMARELWPKGIHVAHLIVDAGIDTPFVRQVIADREGPEVLAAIDPERLMPADAVGNAYWSLFQQPRAAWTFEHEIRPFIERW